MTTTAAYTVLTPLYDPSGQALPYFLRSATSVLNQVDADFCWVISIQEVSEIYKQILMELKSDSRVIILECYEATSLSEHVTLALQRIRPSKFQILCQDDYFGKLNAISLIDKTLDSYPVVLLKPKLVAGQVTEKLALRRTKSNLTPVKRVSRTQGFLETAGINRLGGLSCIAWDRNLIDGSHVLKYDFLADLALRGALRYSGARAVRLQIRGLVVESNWSGQAQFSLAEERKLEVQEWIRDSPKIRKFCGFEILAAEFYRDSTLSH
jgi:hypothetical protein